MTRLGRWVAVCAVVLAAGQAAAVEAPLSGHPVFDRTVELVLDNFHDASALDRFAEAVRSEVRDLASPVVAESPDARVDEAIDTILASLEASHTARYRPDTIDYYELIDIFRFAVRDDIRRLFPPEGEVSYAGIGMIARPRDGRLFVTDVYDDSPADRAGILVGDEVLSVDGAPFEEIGSFRSKAGQSVDVRLRRQPGAAPLTAEVAVETQRPLDAFERAIAGSVEVTERDGQQIGYVRLWTLAAPDALDIVARELAVGRLSKADGLVLDLRGRWGGGRSDAAELFVGGTPSFRLIPRHGEDALANVRWHRPVVAIVDEGARSGLELFAYALKTNGVPLVGTRTAGALLAGRGYLLSDDSLLVLAVSDAVIGEDTRLEDRGIEPDLEVPRDLPYAAGRDPQLEAAMREMTDILDRS